MNDYYEYRHVVSFAETNALGTVYFTAHLAWQGRCREMFLREKAPSILRELGRGGLVFVTLHASCDYLGELAPFDEVAVRMRLETMRRNRMSMSFEILKIAPDHDPVRIATGRQKIACMREVDGHFMPEPFPSAMVDALAPYRCEASTEN